MESLFPPVGVCIYCGATEYAPGSNRSLAAEHIIPLAIGGNLVLPEASCRSCERVTGRIESIALNNHLIGPRRAMGLKGRTPAHKSAKKLPVFVSRNGRDEKVMIPVEDHPSALFLLQLHNPPVLQTLLGQNTPDPVGFFVKWFNYKEDVLREKYGIKEWSTTALDLHVFTRMLAKIGYSYAVAKLGLNGFDPVLKSAINDPDRNSAGAVPYVGGQPMQPPEPALHTISEGTGTVGEITLHSVQIRLFAQFGAPTYVVVVGTKCGQKLPLRPAFLAATNAPHQLSRLNVPAR